MKIYTVHDRETRLQLFFDKKADACRAAREFASRDDWETPAETIEIDTSKAGIVALCNDLLSEMTVLEQRELVYTAKPRKGRTAATADDDDIEGLM